MQEATRSSAPQPLQRVTALRSDLVLVAVLLALHAVCSWGVLWVYTQSNDVPAVYIASGVTWAAFLLLGRREQLIFAIGAAAIQLLGEFLVYKASALLAVTFTLAKILGPFIGARILGRVLGHRGLRASLRDLIWFGIITVVGAEIGLLTPPLGISCFVIKSTIDDDRISLKDVFMGALPFAFVMLIVLFILIEFPILSLALV